MGTGEVAAGAAIEFITGVAPATEEIVALLPVELVGARLAGDRVVAGPAIELVVARRLFISERTVEFHLYNAFRKLGIDTRDALAGLIRN